MLYYAYKIINVPSIIIATPSHRGPNAINIPAKIPQIKSIDKCDDHL
jgi:hypothetical protein